MKKAISIFPKEFGFFPYIFLVYTIMPFLSLLKESGVKQGIGYGMLIPAAVSTFLMRPISVPNAKKGNAPNKIHSPLIIHSNGDKAISLMIAPNRNMTVIDKT